MKKKKSIYTFLLHYGISTVLIIMFLSVVYMLQSIEINNKINIDIYVNSSNNNYFAYLSNNNNIEIKRDSLLSIFVEGKKIVFKIENRKKENTYILYKITPITPPNELQKVFNGDTRLNGFIFTDKIKLISLIFYK